MNKYEMTVIGLMIAAITVILFRYGCHTGLASVLTFWLALTPALVDGDEDEQQK